MFNKIALIGIGLIGSSIARAVRLKGLAKTPFDVAEKAVTGLQGKAIDMIADHEANMVDTPLKLAGGVFGFEPPFVAK